VISLSDTPALAFLPVLKLVQNILYIFWQCTPIVYICDIWSILNTNISQKKNPLCKLFQYRNISKLPMKNERIWSYVKETTSHLQNKLTKNIHLGVVTSTRPPFSWKYKLNYPWISFTHVKYNYTHRFPTSPLSIFLYTLVNMLL
jgi:hypothetical protein